MSEERMQWESERKKDLAEHTFQTLVHNNLRKELELCVHQLAAKAVQEVRDTNFHGNGTSSGSSRTSNKSLHTLNNNNHSTTNSKSSKREEEKSRISTGKVFTPRHSLMTEILQISHIRTIYHIFIVILIILFLNTVVYDLVDQGSINVGFNLIRLGFGKIGTVALIWSCMQLAALLPHPLLRLWANGRQILVWQGKVLRVWDIGWLLFFISFQITFFTLSLTALVKCQLPIVSSLIISIETIRFVMKMHAFVRSVSPRALQRPPAPSSPHIPLPPFSCYTYFLFAPTLIYRDSYPRTGHIRWGVVAVRLLEIAAIIFYVSFLCERFLLGNFSNFGKPNEVLEAKQLVLALFGSMMPALLTYLCGFYLLLHSWLNATSEMLTFADRQFYADWWNKSNYAAFYRTWNMVVHDWLHTYIYKDALILSGSRLVGTLLVFVISAIFHEVILSFAFGFFYPVMLVMFGFFGVLLVFLTKHATPAVGNIFMWWSLAVGNGVMWSLYSMEYFARRNCPTPVHPDIWDLFVPRSWSCHQITLNPDWKFQNPLDQ